MQKSQRTGTQRLLSPTHFLCTPASYYNEISSKHLYISGLSARLGCHVTNKYLTSLQRITVLVWNELWRLTAKTKPPSLGPVGKCLDLSWGAEHTGSAPL
jgi:hypothetical protein